MAAAAQLASALSAPILSAILGGAIALVFLAGYLRRKRADIAHVPRGINKLSNLRGF
jgi:hypothetical protein